MRDVEIIPISIPRLNARDPRRWAGGKLVCSTETSGNGGEWDSHTHPSQHEIIMSGKYNRLHFHLLCLEVMYLFWVALPHNKCVWVRFSQHTTEDQGEIILDGIWIRSRQTRKYSTVFLNDKCFKPFFPFKILRSGIRVLSYFLHSLNNCCPVLSLYSSCFPHKWCHLVFHHARSKEFTWWTAKERIFIKARKLFIQTPAPRPRGVPEDTDIPLVCMWK